jgi:hypothetical protein
MASDLAVAGTGLTGSSCFRGERVRPDGNCPWMWRSRLSARLQRADSTPKEQERLYKEQTGCERADFFRRKREIDTGDFDEHDAA